MIQRSPVYFNSLFYFILINFLPTAKMESIKVDDKTNKNDNNKNEVSVQAALIQSDELFLIGKFSESYNALSSFKVHLLTTIFY